MRLLVFVVISAVARVAAADMTDGAISGEKLAPFAPTKLGGVERSNFLEQAFAVAGAYKLDNGYANLDIQNTFHRGSHDTSLVDRRLESCSKKEKVTGAMACVRVETDRTTIFWYLPDRITVTLSSPTEALTRKMAKDMPIAAIAKLSAAR
jgi:hypothetical protein